mmetsp:Transcript_30879/g.88814  ORF Transcript_30879/g.88814 Transcript_30879/m.88814 type:complete len:313 (-) Transcript_30879:63-1001(-)|eukprot:CAMPEP_0177209276 /NCGR_PEP_ID=MMETSP0367-20130122/30934_1 /TAXON_ID=447022 ORGANISM="Scrippsiella hangoei-like, Strain SHHI-4" /NCGR_SAMPLE_ID=MMETSP0367 /ASSEMBLY_ACC=CAM_ASM_000362 /LENGTH=312 /DNA_ID=CAMNT_0018658307 /DNA_START=52 /DNA_END=990 /DNA_ORIENTATION=+
MWQRRLGIVAQQVCSNSSRAVSTLRPPAIEGMGSRAAGALHRAGLQVALVPCCDDNYCPIVHHAASGATMVVDTPDGEEIKRALDERGWVPTHILNTHHHFDHVGGNEFLKNAFPALRIYGPKNRKVGYAAGGIHSEEIPGLDEPVSEGDRVQFGDLSAHVLEVGGHTDGHIAYFFPTVPMVMAGDCMFNMGCGRVFTGDNAKMQASLQKLKALPDETVVYCAHEYTTANVRFALEVEPGNLALQERAACVVELRAVGEPTVPTLLAHEKETNPFIRWDSPAIQLVSGASSPAEVFSFVRTWKNDARKPLAA